MANAIGIAGSLAGGLLEFAKGDGGMVKRLHLGRASEAGVMAASLAAGGFVALAPDLYPGALAGHDEMDKAAQLMSELPPDRAARDMSGALDHLAGDPTVTGDRLGVVGFWVFGPETKGRTLEEMDEELGSPPPSPYPSRAPAA